MAMAEGSGARTLIKVLVAGQPDRRKLQREPTVAADEAALIATSHLQHALSAHRFKDGTLLESLASDHYHEFQTVFHGKRSVFPSRKITIGSACTGSAAEVPICQAIEDAIRHGGTTSR